MPAVSKKQYQTFWRDGVVHLKNALSVDEINALRDCVDGQIAAVGNSETGYDFEAISKALWSNDTEFEPGNASRFNLDNFRRFVAADPLARPILDDTKAHDDTGRFIYDAAGWRQHDGVRNVALHSRLPEIAADLLNAQYLNFWEDTTFVKFPGTRQRTVFHQDLNYFQIDGDQCVIIWLPLDTIDLENGTVEYVSGSHLWPETFASNSFITQTPLPTSVGPRLPDIEGNRDKYDILSFDVEPGDAVICHVRTVHGAGGNLSNRMRRAMSFRYCGDEVRYQNRSGALKQTGVENSLQDGDRLISDDYPIAWPERLRDMPLCDVRRELCEQPSYTGAST